VRQFIKDVIRRWGINTKSGASGKHCITIQHLRFSDFKTAHFYYWDVSTNQVRNVFCKPPLSRSHLWNETKQNVKQNSFVFWNSFISTSSTPWNKTLKQLWNESEVGMTYLAFCIAPFPWKKIKMDNGDRLCKDGLAVAVVVPAATSGIISAKKRQAITPNFWVRLLF